MGELIVLRLIFGYPIVGGGILARLVGTFGLVCSLMLDEVDFVIEDESCLLLVEVHASRYSRLAVGVWIVSRVRTVSHALEPAPIPAQVP